MKKKHVNFTSFIMLVLASTLFFVLHACGDADDGDEEITGVSLTGDGFITIPDTEIKDELPGIEDGDLVQDEGTGDSGGSGGSEGSEGSEGSGGSEGSDIVDPSNFNRSIVKDGSIYLSAIRTNDYDKKWISSSLELNQEGLIVWPADFGELFHFHIEADSYFNGRNLTTGSKGALADAWVSFSFHSNLLDRRIQFCGLPQFKNSVRLTESVKHYPDYIFAYEDHDYGVKVKQSEILKSWKSSFIAYQLDDNGNVLECDDISSEQQRYKINVNSQNEIDALFRASPGQVELKISNGIKINEYNEQKQSMKRAGIEVILRLDIEQ